ncbi:hypothetical protein [Noviluteimonas gilva]|uniref:Uncharacterized protein n=1 Tax=Noviluteimonas gilva TaxID=2682097 RepID=A0A7C9LYX2_9GAMM|nr:hypothetical protein [Lysobacter gilvus]MUV12588.1 hypothetical protein [Lysobacter gilvus]
MTLTLGQMHDATLLAIRYDWSARNCTFEFAGAPSAPGPFCIRFVSVSELVIPANETWGPSESVLEVVDHGTGRYDFVMQSGDTIAVVTADKALKPTFTQGRPQANLES